MYKRRAVWIALAVISCAATRLFTAYFPLPTDRSPPAKIYPAHKAFSHETGTRHTYGWEAYFRIHKPGYLVRGLEKGGDVLLEGVFRYDFYFTLRPGHLTGLFSGANDVVRIEVLDATTKEILIDRTVQMADFKNSRKKLSVKSLTFSTWHRGGHQFEPRVYWPGLSAVFLQRVELVPLGEISWPLLHQKAKDFEDMMPALYLERGYVVLRDAMGAASDTNDAAIWTGLYAAAQAWNYKATQSREAQKRMEASLWALHGLYKASPKPGTLVRYIRPDGIITQQPPSKDTYTGFFYAAAQALPYVRDPALKQALMADVEGLANHFLDNGLSFVSPYGGLSVDMNPFPGEGFMAKAVDGLTHDEGMRRDIISAIKIARWYFWLHGQSVPPSFARMSKALKHPVDGQFKREILPFANDLRLALRKLHKNVHRSALRGAREGLDSTPYIKLDLLLLKALRNLDMATHGRPIVSMRDLKVMPSEALHALHFLKVAGTVLPRPNRFERAYRANLYDGNALLRTAIQWQEFDEEVLSALMGQTEATTQRTSSAHLSYLALHDLITLEEDPIIRFNYQKLFEQKFRPMRSDGNAMIDAMHASVGLSTRHLGLALWALTRYPTDRRGKGEGYWQENRKGLLAAYGGETNGQAREPLPADVRPRDAFMWQRSAHSIRGDHEGWLYPPLDYLFAYWLARTITEPPPAHHM